MVVSKTTCGTVMAVERTEVVDEDGMSVPLSEHGTTTVVSTWIVVTGIVPAAVPVGVTLAAQVMMAGLELRYGAQIPWR